MPLQHLVGNLARVDDRRRDHDARLGEALAALDRATQLETVDLGGRDVGEHELEWNLREQLHGLGPARRGLALPA